MRNKKITTSYFLLLTFYFLGCAPRVAPPPLYMDMDLSLEEVILKASWDIEVLKAIVGINVEKNNEPYYYVDASVVVKQPNRVHIRMYKFGIVVGDFVVKDNVVHVLSGKGGNKLEGKLKVLGKEFYHSIFWWDGIRSGFMYKEGLEYIIKTENKEIHLNRGTLLPVKQKIRIDNKDIYIRYNEPKKKGGFWYPSVINIDVDNYKFTIKVEKLFINPPLGESDFKIPTQS